MDAQAMVDKFMAEQAPQPDAQPDAQAMVDKFMAEQALPPPPPEPSLGGFLSGLGSMVTSSFGSDPKFDILNRALGGSIQTSTDATRRAADSLTSDQRDCGRPLACAKWLLKILRHGDLPFALGSILLVFGLSMQNAPVWFSARP